MGARGGRFSVEVRRSEVPRALQILDAEGLPRHRRAGFAETFGSPGLVPSAGEERARLLDATSAELERTLETVDGVVSARVHLATPDGDPLLRGDAPARPSQAAVLLKLRAGATAPLSEGDARKLVAGSVPGLAPEAVSVVITSASALKPSATLVALGPLQMTREARPLVLAALVLLCALVAALAGGLLWLARRVNRATGAAFDPGDDVDPPSYPDARGAATEAQSRETREITPAVPTGRA